MNPTLAIIDAIGAHFSLTRATILSKDRRSTVALARQIAMYCARAFVVPQPSLHEIGSAFIKDHTTVLASCRRIERRRLSQSYVADAIDVGRSAAVRAQTKPLANADPHDFFIEFQARNLGAAE
jgi:chromosomal replication initiation ATPase DnaA